MRTRSIRAPLLAVAVALGACDPSPPTPTTQRPAPIASSSATVAASAATATALPRRVVRFKQKSAFQEVFVVDEGDERSLRFDSETAESQSTMLLSDPKRVAVPYVRTAFATLLYVPKPERVLMIGLGGGSFTTALRHALPDVWIEAVEIDPVVVDAAKEFFFVKEDPRFEIRVADGARFIRETPRSYDVIFIDAYGAGSIPEALATPAFFEAVRARMRPDGVAAINLAGPGAATVRRHFDRAFTHVSCAKCVESDNRIEIGRAAPPPDLRQRAGSLAKTLDLGFDLVELASRIHGVCD